MKRVVSFLLIKINNPEMIMRKFKLIFINMMKLLIKLKNKEICQSNAERLSKA